MKHNPKPLRRQDLVTNIDINLNSSRTVGVLTDGDWQATVRCGCGSVRRVPRNAKYKQVCGCGQRMQPEAYKGPAERWKTPSSATIKP